MRGTMTPGTARLIGYFCFATAAVWLVAGLAGVAVLLWVA